jgi:ferrochelatase
MAMDEHNPIGVLLLQTGSPQEPTSRAVASYLRRFLADRRIVEWPRWLWLPLLHGLIVPLRSGRSAALYRSIWYEGEGSPLVVHTGRLAAALQEELGCGYVVRVGMRYGAPSTAEGLSALGGMQRLLLVPLYPQYASATVGSALAAAQRILGSWRVMPSVRMVAGYHRHSSYLDAVAASIEAAWAQRGPRDVLLISFHGLPQATMARGEVYAAACAETATLLAQRLGLEEGRWRQTFQSRFGRGAWLEPDIHQLLAELPGRGIRSVEVVCPGFAADCLETLEEIAIRGAHTFHAAGGQQFDYIPALNESSGHVAMLADLVRAHCASWPF